MNSVLFDADRTGFDNRGHADHEYGPWLRELLRIHDENPTKNLKIDRTGVGTYGIFGARMVFDLSMGFPLLTTKKLHLRSIIYELLWFLQGGTNIKYLNDNGVRIWDEWADGSGNLGPVYGSQWIAWPNPEGEPINQISGLVNVLINNPEGRRHIVTAWNPTDVPKQALPTCHCFYQMYVDSEGRLSCQLYQRSCDSFLGVPFNIASYALLTMMVAQVCGYKPGYLVHILADFHLYSNHVEQARLQLTREPRPLPKMIINPDVKNIFDFKYEDFQLVGYDPHPHIKADVAV